MEEQRRQNPACTQSEDEFVRSLLAGLDAYPAYYSHMAPMAVYLAWLIPWGLPLTLIGESADQVAYAQRELVRVGIDRPAAQATAPVEQLVGRHQLSRFKTATFAQLADTSSSETVHVLDVRRDAEWERGHVRDAQHIPLHELGDRIDEVPDQHVWVHCASGVRASIAASILDAAGRRVVSVDDDFDAASRCGVGVTTGRSPENGRDDE